MWRIVFILCALVWSGQEVQALAFEQGSAISSVSPSQSYLASLYPFSVLINKDVYLFWRIDSNNVIEVVIQLQKQSGWLGVGIGAYDAGHIRTDMIVGINGQVQDRYSYTQSEPHHDIEYNLIYSSFNQTNSQTTMMFQRKLKTSDQFEDREIYTTMTTKVVWAWGDAPGGTSMNQHPGDGYGHLWINFNTGEAYQYSSGISTPLKFIVVVAFLVVCLVFRRFVVPIPLLYKLRRVHYFLNYFKYSPYEIFMIGLLIGANLLLFFIYNDPRIDAGITVAVMAEFSITLVFISVLKLPIFNQLFGISYQKQIKYHRCLAWVAAAVILAHSIVTLINFKNKGTALKELKWMQNIYGLIALGVLFVIVMLALQLVRRRNWELFKATHFLFILFMIFGVLHSTNFIYFCLPGFIIYLGDRTYRTFVKFFSKPRLIEVDSKYHNLTVLKIETTRKYKAGQYIEITFPEISLWQAHPYTISSSPSEKVMTVHAKSLGKWSDKLVKFTITPQTKILLDGPFGLAPPWRKQEVVVLFSGGVGATPWISIVRDHILSPTRPRPSQIYFYPTFSQAADLTWFSDTWELVKTEPSLHVKKYVSHQTKSSEMIEVGALKEEPFTLGRPPIQELLKSVVEENPTAKKILVMACGPGTLWRNVQHECYVVSKMTHKNIYFSHELFKL